MEISFPVVATSVGRRAPAQRENRTIIGLRGGADEPAELIAQMRYQGIGRGGCAIAETAL
jgi:hypothetical protein